MNVLEIAQKNHTQNELFEDNTGEVTPPENQLHINDLPERSLLAVLSYISPRELAKTVSLVCSRWRLLSYHSQLWKDINFRPEYIDFSVTVEGLMALISVRFNPTTKAICSAPCRRPINLISSVHEGVDDNVVPHGFNVTIVGDGGRVYFI